MIRFAVFSDLHYDHVWDADRRIVELIKQIRSQQLDFMVSLGDVCAPVPENRPVRAMLEQTGLPIYYVIGNHDSDHCPQERTKEFWDLRSLHYSFVKEQVKFIVLNTCFMKRGELYEPYYKKNYEKQSDLYPVIPDDELEWLRHEMTDPKLSYVVFSHHSLANEFARRGVTNREQVREILESRRTLLCMNGHDHGDACRNIAGIPYFTVNSMSYIWHGLKEMYVYEKELHERYPILKDLILYRDPLLAIVEIEGEDVKVKGMESAYLRVSPEDVGMENRMWNGVSVEPRVSDWNSRLRFVSKTLIEKGWSGDRKYCAVTENGTKYLLRITSEEKSAGRREMFRMQQEVEKLGIPMCRPVEFGTCEDGVYVIQTWIEGQDAEAVIPQCKKEVQYAYGLDAGRILKQIHRIPAPTEQTEWEARFNRKMDRKIHMYRECPIKFEGAEAIISYIEANRHLLAGRPQCFQHGDYHIGNMMIENGKLVIIDFDRYDFGDPWEEFNRIVWCAQAAPAFASGMVDGYFDGNVPEQFWRLLALYISSNMLSSVPWAIPFGEQEVTTMLNQAKDVMEWYDSMRSVVPSWYLGDRE